MKQILFTACAFNQYGRYLACGESLDSDETARQNARNKAKEVIQRGNPNWKWRINKVVSHKEETAP